MINRFIHPPEHDRWEDYFEPGETLIWQGGPEPGLIAFWGPVALTVFGLPFFAAGLFTLSTGLEQIFTASSLWEAAFGIFLVFFSAPFIGVGCVLSVGSWIYAVYGHRFIRYALSDRRAYIAKSFWNHSLTSCPIGPNDIVTLEQGRRDTVTFKTVYGRDSDGDKTTEKIGFEGLNDGAKVYALIRDIQKGSDETDNSTE